MQLRKFRPQRLEAVARIGFPVRDVAKKIRNAGGSALRLVLRAKILENSSKGRVIPVVVCVEHERIVEVDEE